MLIDFFMALRAAHLPVTPQELLTLAAALERGLAFGHVDDFYALARLCLVKDEKYFDRFDQVFAAFFCGALPPADDLERELPAAWLHRQAEKQLTPEERKQLDAQGWDALMETLRQRLAQQKERHEGGKIWIGTAGSSPFGAWGEHKEGVRIGQAHSRKHGAVKVWEKREFHNADDSVELGSRNTKMALRRLRQFARSGAPDVLDLDATIAGTAKNAGLLDLRWMPESRNTVKVLLLLDAGGSMDSHVQTCEDLFAAAKSEFKHLRHFYFHNCIYETLWNGKPRRDATRTATQELINTYGADYKLIIVGDATMSPYEITHPGGSVEHSNAEAGAVWLGRLLAHFRHAAWLNPVAPAYWEPVASTRLLRDLLQGRMYALTPEGLSQAMNDLKKSRPALTRSAFPAPR
ncbi:vWA domain-containing protein [Paludibacterium yongneupense]|uniref:vWA domain-containing protein n=1 Tax=Paludibacterium yongneupense TaxID=400061 RepID=UPI000402D62A|nr:VWA domain-containing protein [Paludibacterium yongneupense]